ncbi:MAG: hypothetical protein RBT78_00430 [Kiritimatiellia bacterium]|nr:hypothetical protein [Kiritimatiellia bacterium]
MTGFSRMRMRACLAGGVLCAAAAAAQQVEVKLTLAYNGFVVGEPVLVEVELLNATRNPVEVGAKGAPSELFMDVSFGDAYNLLAPVNPEPLAGAFTLNPGQTFRRKLELDKWYPLVREGRYMAQLVLAHEGMRYESVKKSFDVVPGIPVREGVQMFVSRQKLKRRFKLVYWHRNQTDRLFLRTEDEPGALIWDAIDLGMLLRGSAPKLDISPQGEVTVVHRATQDAFLRTVLWSLPDSLEIVERNSLLDPEVSASQRVKSLYGEMAEGQAGEEKKAWWKFW